MECHKYLVVALTHAIYPKLTPLLRARRKTESHAIAKTQASYNSLQKYEQKIPCAMLISEADLRQIQSSTTLYYKVLIQYYSGTTKCYSAHPFTSPNLKNEMGRGSRVCIWHPFSFSASRPQCWPKNGCNKDAFPLYKDRAVEDSQTS